MTIHEFDIIDRYFKSQKITRPDVIVGPGDDCAILQVPQNLQLAVSIDTFTAGTHFFEDMPAQDIGYKALAVNLSDLAAMGADPAWFTCALTMPQVNESWLNNFAAGMFELADEHHMQLIGGDITRGKLSITIQVHGFVPPHAAIKRNGAKVGDNIYISGSLGIAGYVLQQLKLNSTVSSELLSYLYRPQPQVGLGLALRYKANSAIDISDGLIADLSHILQASHVGASVYLDRLSLHPILQNNYDLALSAGDDYQLCFTMPPSQSLSGFDITCIGQIEKDPGLRIYQANGELYDPIHIGYRHF